MKKLLFILFFLSVILIPLASANTILNNSLIGEDKEYFSTNVDNFYTLNISDVLTQIDIKYEINKYPQTIIYNFYNVNNQTITLKNIITKENNFPIGFKITESYTIYKNNIPLNFSYSVLLKQKTSSSINLSYNFLINFDKFKNSHIIKFDGDKLTCCGNWEQHIRTVEYEKRDSFFVNKFSLTNQTSYLSYTELKLKYTDKTLELNQYIIDTKYDSLNFVFKFIFLAGKAIIGIGNLVGAISTTDFLNYQLAVLLPLEILNIILNTIFMILGFIIKMGILFFLGMIIMISFIYSVITTRNIMDAIPKFCNTVVYVLTILIINPVKWIFEKIVKFWSH